MEYIFYSNPNDHTQRKEMSTINKQKVFSLVGVYADWFIDELESVFGELQIYPATNTAGFTCSLAGEQKQIYGITPEYVIVMLVSWFENIMLEKQAKAFRESAERSGKIVGEY